MENWIEHRAEPARLLLAWQAPEHMDHGRSRWAVGVIKRSDEGHVLRYFRDGPEFSAFNGDRPYKGLLDLGYDGHPAFNIKREVHTRNVLETFVRRLPPRRRPDFSEYLRQFRLAPDANPSDFALLGLTEAKLPGDGFSIVDPLDPDADICDVLHQVAGFKYYAPHEVDGLAVGQCVELVAEPDNEDDPRAVKVCVRGRTIGYVNRLQTAAFGRWLAQREVSAVIERLIANREKPRLLIFVRVRPRSVLLAA